MVLEHKAGEKLFVDFAGKKMQLVDPQTGEITFCPVFVACLPYSDYCFAMAVKSQGIDDFLHALRCSLEFFGGVPDVLVPDNLKSAVIKSSRYEPDVNHALEDFANHNGIAIIPARVAKPKDKALVENQVKLVYSRVFAKLRDFQFFDLPSLNKAVLEKVKTHNQTRMQQKPYCREERFLAEEKHLLKPLPLEPYEIKHYATYKVAKNNHIYLGADKHYYSVPFQWTGQQVKVVYTRNMVRIYGKNQAIAIHVRDYKAGAYTTVKEHLCSHHMHYLDRSPGYYLQKAEKMSSELHGLIQLLFKGGRPPEQNYRTCDGLFSLFRKTNHEIFSKAIKAAIECKNYSYRFVLKLIDNYPNLENEKQKTTPLPNHENIRGKEYYTQTTINF